MPHSRLRICPDRLRHTALFPENQIPLHFECFSVPAIPGFPVSALPLYLPYWIRQKDMLYASSLKSLQTPFRSAVRWAPTVFLSQDPVPTDAALPVTMILPTVPLQTQAV